LDPHYRTIAGLCLLIEKEWMAFCFQWGQGNKAKYLTKQHSYLFVQFIDAVWQLWTQSPAQFEFSPHLLVFLLDSVYSCRFGSFLTNTHRDRLKSASHSCLACRAMSVCAVCEMCTCVCGLATTQRPLLQKNSAF
jgi:myotubularin-related protein 1/2